MHLKAAVEAGKHVFAEKPVAVDAPGVRSRAGDVRRRPRRRTSAVVSGLCCATTTACARRSSASTTARSATSSPCSATTTPATCGTQAATSRSGPTWSTRCATGYYFTWLSGDHNVEQHVHSLDKMAWVMKDEYPVKARRHGRPAGPHRPGVRQHLRPPRRRLRVRQRRASCSHTCRQQNGCTNDVTDHIFGTKGVGADHAARNGDAPHHGRRSAWKYPQGRETTTCTRPSTTSCSPASAPASRSTTASTWPRARCWRSWAAWRLHRPGDHLGAGD